MIFNIDAQIIVAGYIDISPFVISYTRTHSMCNVSHIANIKLSPNVLLYLELNEIDINIYNQIQIIEEGKHVLTGFISRIVKERNPAASVTIMASDTYKLAKDYYIDDPNWETHGETLGDMFATLCEMCGLSYVIDSGEVALVVLPPGQTLGLSTVDGTLQELVAYATAVTFVDGTGVIHLRKGPRASDLTCTTGKTLPEDATDPLTLTQGNVFGGSYVESDENARDTVSVWGYAPSNPFNPDEQDLRIVSTRSIDLDLPVPKTAVYSSSLIQTQAEADRLSSVMLKELGKLDRVLTLECQGNPEFAIVKRVFVNVDLETIVVTGNKNITTVATSVSDDGYISNVTFDEFCPRFAGWSLATVPKIFYAGTVKNGVYKSLDAGNTWFEYNSGLPTGNKYVRSLAATEIDEVMAIINGQLWYTTTSGLTISGIWNRRYLPTPINAAGDGTPPTSAGTLITVTSAGNENNFEVLTTKNLVDTTPIQLSGMALFPQVSRSWLYSTTTAGEAWDSTGINYITPSGLTSYNAVGQHASNRYGIPYVTVGGSDYTFPGMWISRYPLSNVCYYSEGQATSKQKYDLVDLPSYGYNFGFHYFDLVRKSDGTPDYTLTGGSGNRVFTFGIRLYSLSGWNNLGFSSIYGTGNISGQADFTLYMKPGMGDVIVTDYSSTPAYQCLPSFYLGINVSKILDPWSVYYRVTMQESVWGSAFWMFLGHKTEYTFNVNSGAYLGWWKTYTGEPRIKGFNTDTYPWEYWPLFYPDRQQDLYPLQLQLGMLKFNLDQIGSET
jgi:hypothetical protein